MKSILMQGLKFGFAAAIFVYLVMSGKVDFYKISQTFLHSSWTPFLWLASGLTLFITAFRWKMLLQSQGISFGFGKTLKLVFIGHFFNVIIPGTISGDVVKAYYVTKTCANEDKNQKLKAMLSVFMDRFIGLVILVVVTFTAVLINYSQIQSKPELKMLGQVVIVGFGFSFIFFLFFLIKGRSSRGSALSSRGSALSSRGSALSSRGSALSSRAEGEGSPSFLNSLNMAFWSYRNSVGTLFWASILTVINFLVNITLYYGTVRALGGNELPISQYFFIVPLGMFAMSIPIAPAGLGIGQGVFLKLFEWSYGRPVTIGSDMMTLIQMIIVSWAIIGLMIYLSYGYERTKHSNFL